MTVEQILKLAEAGFTAEQITKLTELKAEEPQKVEEPKVEETKVEEPAAAPTLQAYESKLNDLLEKVGAATEALQKQAISFSSQPEQPSVDDLLASIINPK